MGNYTQFSLTFFRGTVMKNIFLLGISFLLGCTNNSSNVVPNSQTLSVQADGDFGVIGYNETKIKTIIVQNNEMTSVAVIPILSGSHPDSFQVASYSGCDNLLPRKKCTVKVIFSGRGKLSGIYSATLNLGLESVNLSAQIESVPSPVYSLRIGNQEVDTNQGLDLGLISGTNYKIIWLRIKNVAPVVGNLASLSLSNTTDFNILYNSCQNVALKPEQSCQAAVVVKGDNTATLKTTDVLFDTLSVSTQSQGSVLDYSPSLQVENLDIQVGSVNTTGQILIKVIQLKNNGLSAGALDNIQLSGDYSLLSNNCLNVQPDKTCIVRLGYKNNQTDYGSLSTGLEIGGNVINATVDFESKLENLGSITLITPQINLTNNCIAVNLEVKEINGGLFKRAQSLPLSFTPTVFLDDQCTNSAPPELDSYTSQKTVYIKQNSPQTLDLQVNLLSKSDSKTMSFFNPLSLESTLDGYVNVPLSIPVSGGSGNYTYQIISGVGSLDGANLTSLVMGVVNIEVHDNITNESVSSIVSIHNSLTSTGCSGTVNYDESCDLLISGGKYPYQISVDSGSVTGSIYLSGVCGMEDSKVVNVQITDDLGQILNRTVLVNCAYNFWGNGGSDFNTTGNTNLCDNSIDGEMCVVQYNNFTINSGHTVTTAVRRRGLIIYVKGDAVINGTLSMTARGSVGQPEAYSVGNNGIQLVRKTATGTATISDVSNMTGAMSTASFNATEGQQGAYSTGSKVYRFSRYGGTGGQNSSFCGYQGTNGTNGTFNNNTALALLSTGGGAQGGNSAESCSWGRAGYGSQGTIFSGGSGGAGRGADRGGGDATAYGGAGGSGALSAHGDNQTAGGAGNPAGAAGPSTQAAATGTGGLLILVVKGNLTINGSIQANGVYGGRGCIGAGSTSSHRGAGGGGSGGGSILVLHGGTLVNNGTVQAAGGPGGQGCSGIYAVGRYGGTGGTGAVLIEKVFK